MYKNRSQGFTLIELLVVIAIIGVLSAVVLASLNTARSKGNDAAVKANLSGARAEAEMYYDTNSDYTDVCLSSETNNILDNATAAKNALGTSVSVTRDAIGSATVVACNDTATGWAIQSPLKGSDNTNYFFCVDSTGRAVPTVASVITTVGDVLCQ
jgi:type IV pilus assembly protein PilA